MIVVSWEGEIVYRSGGMDRVLFRVPRWARELWEEQTLKVMCWMDLGKPEIDLDVIEIVSAEGMLILG